MTGDPLAAEYERNLRRDHERGHPGGLTPISKRPCTICLLLAQLSHERAEAARLRDGLRNVSHDLETGDPSTALSRVRALLAEDGAVKKHGPECKCGHWACQGTEDGAAKPAWGPDHPSYDEMGQ